MNCDIIQDMLPLYADGLTSQASNQLIEEHIKECDHCRATMEKMCAPMEQEPTDTIYDYMEAIHAQKRKNRIRLLIACLCTALVLVIGYWIYMEIHFETETPEVVSTDREYILKEVPELEMTDAEKELGKSIFTIPVIQENWRSEDVVVIPTERITKQISSVVPATAERVEVSVHHTTVCIDYYDAEKRIILEYFDGDNTGNMDMLRKTVTTYESDDEPGVEAVYTLAYDVASNQMDYEKSEMEHVWFGFLQ